MGAMERTAAESILKVVAILTAIKSGQEEEVEALLEEADTNEIFTVLVGLLFGSWTTLAEKDGSTIENYLQEMGMTATRQL